MTRTLQVTFVIPFVIWVCYMTFIPMSRVEGKWVLIGLAYAAIYVAVFHSGSKQSDPCFYPCLSVLSLLP
jgi:hypothetical protein